MEFVLDRKQQRSFVFFCVKCLLERLFAVDISYIYIYVPGSIYSVYMCYIKCMYIYISYVLRISASAKNKKVEV